MNCIETLARMEPSQAAKEVFLHDTKAAYAKMVAIEQVSVRSHKSEVVSDLG